MLKSLNACEVTNVWSNKMFATQYKTLTETWKEYCRDFSLSSGTSSWWYNFILFYSISFIYFKLTLSIQTCFSSLIFLLHPPHIPGVNWYCYFFIFFLKLVAYKEEQKEPLNPQQQQQQNTTVLQHNVKLQHFENSDTFGTCWIILVFPSSTKHKHGLQDL